MFPPAPFKNPVGLTTGKYPPYAILTDSKACDAERWSDDTTGTHGLLYPTNYASTEQSLINTNMTALKAICSPDDDSYASSATKKKIWGNFYNAYKGIQRIGMYVGGMSTNSQVVFASNVQNDLCEIATDKVALVYVDSSDSDRLKVKIATLSGSGTWTLGSAVTLDSTASANEPRIAKLGTDKFVVGYRNSSTTKAVVVTVSGTTATAGTPANATTNSGAFNGICKLNTDKFGMSFIDNTSNDIEGIGATVSGTTITFGSKATIYTGTSSQITGPGSNLAGKSGTTQLNTDKMFVIWAEASTAPYYAACTFSGTTMTAGSAGQLTNSEFNYDSKTDVKQIDTDKVMILGGSSTLCNGVVITYSGTIATVGSTAQIGPSISSFDGRSILVQSTTKVLLVLHGAVSSVSGTYANEVQIGGRTLIKGDTHMVEQGSTAFQNFIQTTNYTVCQNNPNSSATVYMCRHGSVTLTVNGTAFATTATVPLLAYLGSSQSVKGRKIYLSIQNNNAFTQSVYMGNVYANVE